MEERARRLGAVGIVLGLLLGLVGIVASGTPAAALADTTGLICNNQKDRADQDCEGANRHGTIATSFDADGNLLFDLDADPGFGGWKQLYICIPGTPKTNRADCQGNTASVLHPQPAGGGAYDVTTPATNTENDKDVSFACSTSINAKVYASSLPAGPVAWTVHVNTCGGGTDEAFGTSTRTPPPNQESTYACLAATDVTQTTATLRGSTDDENAESATFEFTAPAGAPGPFTDTTSSSGAFSVPVTGLLPNTSYTYSVRFDLGEGSATGAGCSFTTAAVPPTYACVAPTDVTATSATLKASTTDGEVDSAVFALTPASGSAAAGVAGAGGAWSSAATGLASGTSYTYTVTFQDGGDVAGTASGAVCAFTTAQVLSVAQEQPAAPAAPAVEVAPLVVAAAPAAAPATLPRTGTTSEVLVALGLALVLLGLAAVLASRRDLPVAALGRPDGHHYSR